MFKMALLEDYVLLVLTWHVVQVYVTQFIPRWVFLRTHVDGGGG